MNGGARLRIVRHFGSPGGAEQSPVDQLLGLNLDRDDLEFLRVTRAEFAADEYEWSYPLSETPAQVFVENLVRRFPQLSNLFEEHVGDHGMVLGHVIFGIGNGITDRVVAAYLRGEPLELDWPTVLTYLDDALDAGSKDVDTIIGTSFLYQLPWPGQPGADIVDMLPAKLRCMFDAIRPA